MAKARAGRPAGLWTRSLGAAKHAGAKGPPPVHLWNPPFCGDLDMRIAADGTWFYLGTPIGRPALVQLFASVLKREDDKYFLVTPVEKCGILVEDAPFLAVEMNVDRRMPGRCCASAPMSTTGWHADADHALRFEPEAGTGGLKPYLHVRRDLWAKVTRALFYDLVELGEEREVDGEPHVRRRVARASSSPMAPADALEGVCADGADVAELSPNVARGRSFASDDSSPAPGRGSTLDVPDGLNDPAIIPQRGDHDLDPVMREIAAVRPIRPAAVLVPIVAHAEPTVLLTQRTAHLPEHAGQVSFPGGKIDPDDATPLDAALREAEEEIGLDRRFVEPVGYLDLYMTTLGYRIVPTLARVTPGLYARPQSRRGRRRVRGAARLPDGGGEPQAPQPRMEGHDAHRLRDAVRRAVDLGRDGGDFAEPVRAGVAGVMSQ